MYQVIGLRPIKGKHTVTHAYFPFSFASWEDLVLNHEKVMEEFKKEFGEKECYNLFYSASKCEPNHRTRFIEQEIIPFDFDEIDGSRIQEYIDVFVDATGMFRSDLFIVSTGNGLHIIVRVRPFEVKELQRRKPWYSAICTDLKKLCDLQGLPVKMDTSVWCKTQLLRLPGTQNRKPVRDPFGKDTNVKQSIALHKGAVFQDFDWEMWDETVEAERSAKEKLGFKKTKTESSLSSDTEYKPNNPDYVMKNCPFLAGQFETKGKGSDYNTWFTALGVTSHFKDDDYYTKRISEGHDDYSLMETLKMADNCRRAGPRTCGSISLVHSGCATCRWRDSGIGTPLNLRPYEKTCPDYIDEMEVNAHLNPMMPLTADELIKGIDKLIPQGVKDYEQETKKDRKQKGDSIDTSSKHVENKPENGHIEENVCGDREKPGCDVKASGGQQDSGNEKKKEHKQSKKGDGTTGTSSKLRRKLGRHPEVDWEEYLEAGFSDVTENPKTGKKTIVRKPNLLVQYFDHLYHYVVVSENETVYIYDDGAFKRMDKLGVKKFAQDHYRPISSKDNEINEFYNKVLLKNQVSTEFITPAKEGYVNLSNGVLEIDTGKLLAHSPSYGFMYKLPYDYQEGQECTLWNKLMENISCGNREIIQTIEEYLGYCAYGGTYDFAKILIFSGEGENGKSTVINVMEKVLGAKNCSGINISDIRQNKFLTYELIGKLVNFSEEEPADCFKNPSNIKRLTGNSPVWVERKREQGHSFVNTAKMVLTYNTIPRLTDDSHGMKRRLLIVPFKLNLHKEPDRKIPKVVKRIAENELSAILVKCLARYNEVIERDGFTHPKGGGEEMKRIITESNDVYSWCAENLEITGNENDYMTSMAIFEMFKNEAPSSRLTQAKLTREVRKYLSNEEVVSYGKFKINGQTFNAFRGIKSNI